MASTDVYLSGKIRWAKLVQPDAMYDCWSVVLYPDDASYAKILELKENKGSLNGILNVIKKDEDGYHVTFKRPTEKKIRGKLTPFSPPQVLQADGNAPLGNVAIGNGSDATLKISVYDYAIPTSKERRGRATRLEAVRVDNLIPYEVKRDFSDTELKQVGDLPDMPVPHF